MAIGVHPEAFIEIGTLELRGGIFLAIDPQTPSAQRHNPPAGQVVRLEMHDGGRIAKLDTRNIVDIAVSTLDIGVVDYSMRIVSRTHNKSQQQKVYKLLHRSISFY